MTIRGIIFDMDGVLCDSEPFICEAACRMFRERGVQVQPEDFRPFVGMGEERFLGGVAEKYGAKLDLAAAKARTYAIYQEVIRGRLRPSNGADALLDACRARGLRMAVASSADEVKVAANLAELGFPPSRFDAVVNGLLVARKKPAPDIFLLAAERIGLPPEDCLVVEDAPAGLRAAQAAGCAALGVRSSFDDATLRAAGASWTVRDLAEACGLLPGILKIE
jgi:HAD superfamily hydrolase (TIGR01509 family)